MALTACDGSASRSTWPAQTLVARIWRADVGRIPLYLLDADVDENPPEIRDITDRLYGGDTEHRLRQEILLGIGGVRALDALGIDAQVFHTNEGHAGFLGLERIRQLVKDPGLSYREAIEAVRAGCIFTTHTPVPAGIDRFPRELIERYFSGWATEVGISLDELMELGHRPGDEPDERFNMAVMGLRLAGRSNAVASSTARSAATCSPTSGPTCRPTRSPSRRSPTASTPTPGCPPRWATCSPATCCPSGTRPTPSAGPGSRTRPTTSCGGHGSRAARRWSRSCEPSCADQLLGPRPVVERRGVDRRGARPQGAHHRLRPALRHLQAGHAPPRPSPTA